MKAMGSPDMPQRQTHDQLYQFFILAILIKLGGKAETKTVLDRIGKAWQDKLSGWEFEALKTGETRWKNSAKWARKHLQLPGYLRQDSPHGIWEITYEGRQHYREWAETLKKELAGNKSCGND